MISGRGGTSLILLRSQSVSTDDSSQDTLELLSHHHLSRDVWHGMLGAADILANDQTKIAALEIFQPDYLNNSAQSDARKELSSNKQ